MRAIAFLLVGVVGTVSACVSPSSRSSKATVVADPVTATTASSSTTPNVAKGMNLPGFAVVELFSSEGCSSCPAADTLLRELSRERGDVYAIELHVDYWDRLGWHDPFGAHAFGTRQENYAAELGSGVYTPQLVVNGREEVVGTNATDARAAIGRARATPATSTIALTLSSSADDLAHLHAIASVSPPRAGGAVTIVLVEDGLSTKVTRGENAGATLHHDGVARGLSTVRLTTEPATLELTIAPEIVRSRASVIAFVQDPTTHAIVAATRTQLP